MHNIDNLAHLQQAYRQQCKLKYLFFWGHTPKQANQVDNAVLSQWFPAPFEVNGEHYATAEHYMMAEKARLFGAEDIRLNIIASQSPKQAKDWGRSIQGFDELVWKQHRFAIVCAGNYAKFAQHPDLQAFLLNTGNRVLVEASPVDKIWGIGMAQDHPNCTNPLLWQGLNLLGFALMKVRAQLQGE